jgi:hypothetical protein
LSDEPTEITREDIDKVLDYLINSEIKTTFCNWCGTCPIVRAVGVNYICEQCEIEERKAGKSLVI